ncbi:hypothetical protein J7E79_02875 [Bacillus sp. ISL-40]|uniref:hypothetical protein n=1 Tax=Bacillus sp. ISL-40 TaxID=2819126 RepID=UPI001BEAF6F8|nr:hypothetical protein [Bacillus sp. ISL-40]MBT2696380.1 hypothetical protein [Bacillus sp. ISL-40]
MQISINIQAPEIAKAIESLAAALSGKSIQGIALNGGEIAKTATVQESTQQTAPVTQPAPQQANVVPFQQQQPVPNVVPVQQAPAVQQPPVQQPQAVPTSAPSYSMDQLAVAATQLMDAGRQPELLSLLASFGVPSLMALPKEQYGAFATQLRGMGANI